MTAYTFDENIVSDLHKDARGFRPSDLWWIHWHKQTDDGKQAVWDYLCDELDWANKEEQRQQEESASEFETRIAKAIELGAKDEETAIRWILEGEALSLNDYQYGADYVAYHFGLSYRNKWKSVIDRVAHQKVCEMYEEEIAA